ncbi:MAG: site-2 protease family protein [Anaerolineae bacterium]|jgi:membrane-associated protease RseP (regulator of RpoE activity)|nr:site-2 protease family protein [Anaerolineae bacterium]MBT7069391.1 site-2 protease family protein [Anaerolineae bacterium]MBT7326562.1 site-2 protease family protein [Anaerolineae bacterium]
MNSPDTEILNKLVARIFQIESVTLGDTRRGFLARYQGRLLGDDSAAAYDRLAESLKPYTLTPLFQVENGEQVILLVHDAPPPKMGKPSRNLLFFILTLISVLFTGSVFESTLSETVEFGILAKDALLNIWRGFPFALSLLGILLAHEFGHYLMGRYHKTNVSLPFFLPLPYPLSILGTLGAFIQMKERPKNKRVLFDIGIAGPLAGLVVAIPVLLYGLSLSELTPLTGTGMLEGNSILYLLSKYVVFGKWLPEPVSYMGVPPFLYWVRYLFTSTPSPLGALDVQVHNIAWAGWAGLLVTSLNLIPIGTLDGGHIIHSALGDKAKKIAPLIFATLIGLGVFWEGWWLWAAMLYFLGRRHAQTLDQITELDPRRQLIAKFMLFIFILVFIPVPLVLYG